MASKPRAAAGAPSPDTVARRYRYSPALKRRICRAVARGASLLEVADRPGMPGRERVSRWVLTHRDFRTAYTQALELAADRYVEQILAIADGTIEESGRRDRTGKRDNADSIARLKLRIDTRKWLMAKLAPNRYGERAAVSAAKLGTRTPHIHGLSDAQLDEIIGSNGEDRKAAPRTRAQQPD
jgi:transposase-like protein